MFDAKRAAATMQLITAKNGDPKRLWRSLSTILAEPDPVIPHTTDEFSDFFIDKVARIRALSIFTTQAVSG